MRSREEVLREFGANPLASYKELEAASNAMADRIRALEAPRGEAVACAEAFHVAEYIEEEMRERDWSRDELATRMMPPDKLDPLDHEAWGITRLALDLLLDVRDSGVVLGEQADALGRAFGTSAVLWRNLHNAWRGHPTTATTTHPPVAAVERERDAWETSSTNWQADCRVAQAELAFLRTRAERAEADNARLQEMVAASGKGELGFDIGRQALTLRFSVQREVLSRARSPEEVFRHALVHCMDEYREWMRKNGPQPSTAQVFAEAMNEALASIPRDGQGA